MNDPLHTFRNTAAITLAAGAIEFLQGDEDKGFARMFFSGLMVGVSVLGIREAQSIPEEQSKLKIAARAGAGAVAYLQLEGFIRKHNNN
jgi:uncharacterized membrane protein YjjP (DUF1212 family)